MKRSILVREIVSDLRRGVPDDELMKRYGLSEDGLERLFDKLLKALPDGSRDIRMELEE